MDNEILDLENIMDFKRTIKVGNTYTTTTGKKVYGHDFIVKDKDGNTIPNCVATNPNRRTYNQLHTDENGKIIITTDTGLDNGWHKYSGILEGHFTDKDMTVEYTG